jgi:hypothetical protein
VLDTNGLVEFKSFRNQVGVEFKKSLVKESGKVFGEFIGFLETGSQSIS